MNGLFGGKDNIDKLNDYIQEPGHFESNRYAWESLFEPEVVETDAEDKQGWQIRESLKTLFNKENESPLSVLDFGAGKGRLISNLHDNEGVEHVNKTINYVAYDLYNEHKETCLSNIEQVYLTDTQDRYYNDVLVLQEKLGAGIFDVAVLTNVLHEIEPEDWIELFSEGGLLSSNLVDNGKLLIVEDQLLMVGENAHKYGFIMFDREQLKLLFNCSDAEITTSIHDSNDRLKCHLISKSVLSNICKDSIKSAVNNLRISSVEEIKAVRNEEPSYRNGRIHSFWLQQQANSAMYLLDNNEAMYEVY